MNVCACASACVWVCVCVTYYFSSFILYEPPSSLLRSTTLVLCYTVLSSLIYANSSSAPAICRLLRPYLTCHSHPFPPVIPPTYCPPISLASCYLASGILRTYMVLAVPSMPHPPYQVYVEQTPPCTWCLVGEWCWISLSLVTS